MVDASYAPNVIDVSCRVDGGGSKSRGVAATPVAAALVTVTAAETGYESSVANIHEVMMVIESAK